MTSFKNQFKPCKFWKQVEGTHSFMEEAKTLVSQTYTCNFEWDLHFWWLISYHTLDIEKTTIYCHESCTVCFVSLMMQRNSTQALIQGWWQMQKGKHHKNCKTLDKNLFPCLTFVTEQKKVFIHVSQELYLNKTNSCWMLSHSTHHKKHKKKENNDVVFYLFISSNLWQIPFCAQTFTRNRKDKITISNQCSNNIMCFIGVYLFCYHCQRQ